jgi:hypothetical protein
MAKGKASNQSLYSNNDLSSRVRIKARNAGPNATAMNNAWRKAKEEDPTLEFRMSFMEWKKGYEREYFKKRREKRKK